MLNPPRPGKLIQNIYAIFAHALSELQHNIYVLIKRIYDILEQLAIAA